MAVQKYYNGTTWEILGSGYITDGTSEYTPSQIKAIDDKVLNKVDKVSGKGLSTNDYTTTEKNKLAGVATGANNYTHPGSGTNPHGTTNSNVGLINVYNVILATTVVFVAHM